MSNVISLAEIREQRIVEERKKLYDMNVADLLERIVNLPPKMLSPGATVLLIRMAYILGQGHHYMSYPYLLEMMGGISTRTLTNYLTELEESKVLRIRRSRIGKQNAVNQFEIDFNGPLKDSMSKLKLPKKPNEMGTVKSKVPSEGVLQKVKGYNINIDSKDKLIPKGIGRSAAPGFETISDAITFSEKRITRRRAEKVAKATRPGSQLTLAGVKATWAAAMLKHYPTVPPVVFTQKEFAIFKAKVQPLLATCNLSELFEYIVSSWQSLRETKFVWLRVKGKDVSIAPSLPEMMRYWKIFAQSFADSRMATANNDVKAKRTEVEDLEDRLASERAEKAKLAAEKARLQEKLAKAERMAFSKPIELPKETRSLSARQKALEDQYNDDHDLPDWR